MVDESLKIKMDYAESSEILRTSLKMKGAPVALGFARRKMTFRQGLQRLGWTKEAFKKIGVKYAFLRSRRENNWNPHYFHNLDNLIRFGGLFPHIHVHADIHRTRLLGATHVYEGGCMMVRARDNIYRMKDLKARRSASRRA